MCGGMHKRAAVDAGPVPTFHGVRDGVGNGNILYRGTRSVLVVTNSPGTTCAPIGDVAEAMGKAFGSERVLVGVFPDFDPVLKKRVVFRDGFVFSFSVFLFVVVFILACCVVDWRTRCQVSAATTHCRRRRMRTKQEEPQHLVMSRGLWLCRWRPRLLPLRRSASWTQDRWVGDCRQPTSIHYGFCCRNTFCFSFLDWSIYKKKTCGEDKRHGDILL